MLRLKRILDGLISVTIGVMIIANSVGALSWRVWATVFSLWPLLLVAIGIDLIGKGAKLNIVRVLSSLLLLGGLIYAVMGAPQGGVPWAVHWGGSDSFDVEIPASRQVEEASARIAIPAATIDIAPGDELFVASGRVPYGEPELSVERIGVRSEITLESEAQGPVYLFTSDAYTDVELGRGVTWELDVASGVAQGKLDLADLEIAGVQIDSGLALLDLELGEPAHDGVRDIPVGISSGLSQVHVRIPHGVEARVDVRYGLGDVDVPADWAQVSDDRVWESEGFAQARARYVIVIEGGMGIVDVVQD